MAAQALVHMLDNGAHLAALRRARRRAQDRRHRRALDRCEAALVVMRVPERQLLAGMRRAERIVDVEDLKPNLNSEFS